MTYRIKASITAPGANGNTTTLFNSTSRPGIIEKGGHKYYVASLKTAAAGTFNVYASGDSGATWHQFFSRYIPATESAVMRHVPVRIDQHADIKVEWVNGGSAQTTWYVAQALTDDVEFPFSHGYDDLTYIVNGDMSATAGSGTGIYTGPAIQVGPEGRVVMQIQWSATLTPNGILSLEYTLNGTDWKPVPGASSEFTSDGKAQPAGTAGDIVCSWREMLPFKRLRLKYTRTNGGSTTGLQAQITTW